MPKYEKVTITVATDAVTSTGVKILGADNVFVEVNTFSCSGANVGINPQVSYDDITYRDLYCLTRTSGTAGVNNKKLLVNQGTGNYYVKLPVQGFSYLRIVTNLTATASFSMNVHVSLT